MKLKTSQIPIDTDLTINENILLDNITKPVEEEMMGGIEDFLDSLNQQPEPQLESQPDLELNPNDQIDGMNEEQIQSGEGSNLDSNQNDTGSSLDKNSDEQQDRSKENVSDDEVNGDNKRFDGFQPSFIN